MSGLIFKKMSDVMKEIKSVSKDQTNNAQGFKFRGIDQFVNALYPALTKHGVFMTPEMVSYDQEIREVIRSNGKPGVDKHVKITMKYTFHAEDGSSVSCSIPAEGVDSGDKATNKALSAALKYCLIQTFSVPTVDMEEADRDSPELGTPAKTYTKPISVPATSEVTNLEVSTQEAPKKISSFKKPTKVNPAVIQPSELPLTGDDWN